MIKNLTGIVKYPPYGNSISIIPFRLEDIELESEPKNSKEATSKRNLIDKLRGLYEVEIACYRHPAIQLGDKIKVYPRDKLSKKDLLDDKRRGLSLIASQIDVIDSNEKLFASYFTKH